MTISLLDLFLAVTLVAALLVFDAWLWWELRENDAIIANIHATLDRCEKLIHKAKP